MSTWIPAAQVWPLLGFIVGGVALCIHLEQNHRWAARISGPVLALLVAMILSNCRIVPTEAPLYDIIDEYFVPIAIPLLLFQANLRRILRETGPMFLTFHIATVGSILGAFAAAWMFKDSIPRVAEVAGIMTASFVGGGVNFVAVKNTYNVPADITNPLLVADNFVMAGFFAVLLLMAGSKLFRRWYPHPHSGGETRDSRELAAYYWRRKEIALKDVAQALGLAIIIVAVSKVLAAQIKSSTDSKLIAAFFASPYLLMTILTTTLVTCFHRTVEKINGADELGAYLLYIFFFVIGLRADLLAVIHNMPALFGLCVVMAACNLGFTMVVGRVFRLNLEELLLASNATLGGPASAAAMAISSGWGKLILPGLLAALWGYIIGTFVGVAVTETIRSWLGSG
jgi:uncharacterized membrane protein